MRFLIISHTLHKQQKGLLYAYAPYVREMNLWLNHVDEVEIVAPKIEDEVTAINMAYKHDSIVLNKIPSIAFTSFKKALISLFSIPFILFKIFAACSRADHIHLRCPGNIGLLGCVAQVFFPKKIKTAKYAGNWDPKSVQPLSYRLQKKILSSTFWTKNMSVLVYGQWKNQSKNIKPFFTATFKNSEIETIAPKEYSGELKFVFVGSLVKGKRPLLTIKIIEQLHKLGKQVRLDLFGDGVLREELQAYITNNKLEHCVKLHGNQDKEVIKTHLKLAHFSILASKSEGWPKAIAEAMFFGVIPIATAISCVPYMLDYGQRGILITPNLDEAVETITNQLETIEQLKQMSQLATEWSQNYTLDTFEKELVKLLSSE